MLQKIKAQNIKEVTGKNITKRLHFLNAMIHYEDQVRPYLAALDKKNDGPMTTARISEYLMVKVAPGYGIDPNAFKYPNISNIMTAISRAFEWAGLLKREQVAGYHRGKKYIYHWLVDVAKHKLTKEQMEWAFLKISKDPEFKKTVNQSKRLRKPVTAVDKMDDDAKTVLQKIIDENEQLKERIMSQLADTAQVSEEAARLQQANEKLQETNDDLQDQLAQLNNKKPEFQTDDEGTGFDMSVVKEKASDADLPIYLKRQTAPAADKAEEEPSVTAVLKTAPKSETTHEPPQQSDPFAVVDQLRGQLTRGSQIEIKIVL